MNKNNKYQTLDEFTKEYLKESPENMIGYLETALEEFENDGDLDALLLAIKRISELKGGITELAKKTNLSRQNLYKIFSHKVNPRFDTLLKILKALGYTFSIKKLAKASYSLILKISILYSLV